MGSKIPSYLLIMISILFLSSTSACGGSRMIKGRVVDAVTGKPIEGVAVLIDWWKSGEGPPGLAGSVKVEVAEALTDAEGIFEVPKYSMLRKWYNMAIYKKGYVCWSSRKIFPGYQKRIGFSLKNGMIIKLERFKKEYSKEKHANFTTILSINRKGSGLFDKAIEPEKKIDHDYWQRQRRRMRGK